MAIESTAREGIDAGGLIAQFRRGLRRGPILFAVVVLGAIVLLVVAAPLLGTVDPTAIDAGARLRRISAAHWLGTDAFGRDIWSRVIYGGRTSLLVGLGAAALSIGVGLVIGAVAGYVRVLDSVIMRVMDGAMAIPTILLAIALVALGRPTLSVVVLAIALPEVPRVVRLVRSVILTIRGEPYVEAAIALGTRAPMLLMRHIVPNTIPPLIVQGTFIFASAMLTEASMSFLGVGLPPEIPSWGNIMAEGRIYFQMLPGLILYAGILLALTVLSVNLLGDALRDALDPRMARRL